MGADAVSNVHGQTYSTQVHAPATIAPQWRITAQCFCKTFVLQKHSKRALSASGAKVPLYGIMSVHAHMEICCLSKTRQNDTKQNDTKQNDTKQNDTKQNDTK